MTLAQLLAELPGATLSTAIATRDVADVCVDSRHVTPGALFIAVPGTSADGAAFASAALAAGACAVVGEGTPPASLPDDCWVSVPDARSAVALLAAAFHGHPDRALDVYAVTGTNGKTTTATVLRAVLEDADIPCGLVSTVRCLVGGRDIESDQTTPDATVLQRYLAEMRLAGCRAASIEVSSHALMQHRVAGMRFAAAAFTNLTQDHLDYHGTMEAYGLAKRRLFEQLGENPDGLAVVNLDDSWGRELLAWLRESAIPAVTYGLDAAADFRAEDVRLDARRTRFRLVTPAGRADIETPLLGRHNVHNLLAVAGLASVARIPLPRLAATFAAQPPVRGRLERVETPHHPASLFVDYAHTPDALAHVLQTLREVTTGRLIVVFGCGGNRDRGKRPKMGSIAYELADVAVVTSDNPRREQPGDIIDEILAGMPAHDPKVIVHADRREAIRTALSLATEPGDVVLVAGKGHETYQIFAERTLHFDDREELLRLSAPNHAE
jgi:UDP-N-acetylmuramoyl-L-alanyl-D-glutamate--2,6-diaminopimelate ligase